MANKSRFGFKRVALAAGLLCFLSGTPVLAQTSWSTHPQASASAEEAKRRFEADKKLCADEASPEARIQCRRDAQTLYDTSLAALRTQPGTYRTQPSTPDCADCARVTAVTRVDKAGEANAVGMIAGGVAGAMLGRQVGGGFGKDLATIAGAAGGAYAGKKIQENMNTTQVWQVSVTDSHGGSATFDFAQDPGFKVGDRVRKSGNTVVRH